MKKKVLTQRDNFPAQNSEAPDVAFVGENIHVEALWGHPSDGKSSLKT